jgi:type IV secretion system protein VirD4
MDTSHGSAKMSRLAPFTISADRINSSLSNGFILGTNLAPGQESIDPGDGQWFGELILDKDNVRIDNPDHGAYWNPSRHPGMALTFGYAGSGKGGLLIPAALSYPGSMVFNDPKGELYWLSAKRRARNESAGGLGHKVANCDPFGEVQTGYGDKVGSKEPAMRYNPLAGIAPTQPDFAERVATVAEALAIDKDERGTIFTGTGRDLIEGVIAAEATMNPGKATLREVRRWLTLSDLDFSGAVTAYLAEYPSGLAASKLRGFTDMTSRTNQSTKITAKEQTKFLDSESLISYFEPEPGEPTFSFDELSTGKLTVHVVLPGRLLGSYSGFSRIMFNQAIEAVQRSRKENLDTPVVIMIDEAGTSIGKLESVEQAYGIARGSGMVLWSFYQDIAQLQRDYPKSWETFISNSMCVTVTGARDQATCKYFSDYLGTTTIQVRSRGRTEGQSRGGASSGQSENIAPTGRLLMTPEEIRTMHNGELLVLMPTAFRTNLRQSKIVYFRDYRFNHLYRPDPKYGDKPLPAEYPRGPYYDPPAKFIPGKPGKPIFKAAAVVNFLVWAYDLFGTSHYNRLGLLLAWVLFLGGTFILWRLGAGRDPEVKGTGWYINPVPDGGGTIAQSPN